MAFRGYNLEGLRFNRLVVIRRDGTRHNAATWWCRCDCDPVGERLKSVQANHLKSGLTQSCGCLNRERTSAALKLSETTHGMRRTRIYAIWLNMKDRCYRESNKDYHSYGGRGIRVCDAWRESFEAFYAAVGDPPSDRHTLDREQVNGDYEPGNWRWALRVEQANNMRKNVMIMHGGRTQTAAQWGRELGIGACLIAARIRKGWPPEKALSDEDFRGGRRFSQSDPLAS